MGLIEKRCIVLAEQAQIGSRDAERDLGTILGTVGVSEITHDQVRQTLGDEKYHRMLKSA